MKATVRLAKLGLAAGATVAAVALTAAPQASAASSGQTVRLTGPTNFTASGSSTSLASCSNDLTGPVTSHNASESLASINNVTFTCQNGTTSVTANALPWTLHLFNNGAFTLDGFDVKVTTSQGSCRYTGDVLGVFQFSGVDDIRISMARQAGGCGWPDQVFGSGFPEHVIVAN